MSGQTTRLAQEPAGPRVTVVGNPGSRRVTGYVAAAHAAGLPAPQVVPWQELLRHGAAALPELGPEDVVRLDSPGEDTAVHALLRGTDRPARVEGGARWYRHVTAIARTVGRAARVAGATLLDDPEELATLCDKRRCHAALRESGLPVPESPTSGDGAQDVRGWEDVRAAGLSRFFVKPAHGSAASGMLAVETAGPGRVQAFTTIERGARGELLNSLLVRRVTSETEIAALVDALAPDGLHVERWWPKATQHGRVTDLRVVVTAGRATHGVLRASHSPMTALHSGGVRGNLATARVEAGPRWSAALDVCERAAARFPGTLCVGVDLLPGTGWRRMAVGEINAFGDLLPGYTGLPGSGAERYDTHRAQVAAVVAGWRPGTGTPRGGEAPSVPPQAAPGRGRGARSRSSRASQGAVRRERAGAAS